MKIERIEPFPVRLPLTAPVRMANETIEAANNLFVRIESDGISGWGEAASSPTLTGELAEGMLAAARFLIPFLIGRDIHAVDDILAEMDKWLYGNTGAKAAIDMALLDLIGKAVGRPVHALLGERRRERVPALWLLGHGDASTDVAEARARREEGYTAYKIKVGINLPSDDLARTRAICEALGSDCLVMADANQAWTVRQAISYVSHLEEGSIAILEQPVAGHDLEGMTQVNRASSVMLGADEGIHSLEDIRRHHETRAADGCSLKTIKLGGISRAYEAAKLCYELGMNVNLASTVAESSLAATALVHLGAAVPAIGWGLSPTTSFLVDDITDEPVEVVDGHLCVPSAPGLGVRVDEERIDKYRLPM